MILPSLSAYLRDSGQKEYFLKLFVNLAPSSDVTLYVLNAHLLAEELVFKLIQNALRNPSALNSIDLNYKRKCILLEALYGDELEEWLYPALAQLGVLRNKCAHILDNPQIDEVAEKFIAAAYDRTSDNENLLMKKSGRGFSREFKCSEVKIKVVEECEQREHNVRFRLPMGCERIIECLLRKWHGMQNASDI